MREIKYKVWDNKNKEWYDSAWMRDGIFYPKDASNGFLDHHILVEFTGLKDKNDKEIYEGDILYHKYIYSPELSSEQFEEEEKIEVKIPDFFHYLGSSAIEHSPETKEEFVGNMEIIGNIYENKT